MYGLLWPCTAMHNFCACYYQIFIAWLEMGGMPPNFALFFRGAVQSCICVHMLIIPPFQPVALLEDKVRTVAIHTHTHTKYRENI